LEQKKILLDNFSIQKIKQAVQINQKKATLEASGNITIKNIRNYAKTGVDRISVGSLTKNIEAIDFSVKISQI
jgi:nicotinate-nucleotide pyrophosphorylase (carboxylating)